MLVAIAFAALRPRTEQSVPAPLTNDDRQIFEIVLSNLLTWEEIVLPSLRVKNRTTIILAEKTDGFSGFLSEDQMKGEFGDDKDHVVPSEIRADLRRRNSKGSLTLRAFKPVSPRVLLRDLEVLDGWELVKKYPNVRCWIEAWLPGYSKDGRTAVFRFMFGPTAHGASGTYLLRKIDGKWKINWREASHYL